MSDSKKYIFLDVDGVLNTRASWRRAYQIDKKKVDIVCEIAKTVKADIVLSSTWRAGWSRDGETLSSPQIQNLYALFEEHGKSIVGVTPILRGRSRCKEIERFLYFNPCKSYIILDDDASLFENKKNLYLVNCEVGITQADAKEIIKIMKSKK